MNSDESWAEMMAERTMDAMLVGVSAVLSKHGVDISTPLNEADSNRLTEFMKVEGGKAIADVGKYAKDKAPSEGGLVRLFFQARMRQAGVEAAKGYLGMVN